MVKDKVNLVNCMTEHSKRCVNPYCMCFSIKTIYHQKTGAFAAKQARIIYKEASKDTRNNYKNGFMLFNDLQAIQQSREASQKIITTKTSSNLKSVSLASTTNDPNIETSYFLDLETEHTFKVVIASFFSQICRNVNNFKMFEAVLTACRFLVFEYMNQIAALTTIYEYTHSSKYVAESNWFKDYILQSLILESKTIWTNSEIEQKISHIPGLDLSKVLDYRLRVHSLRNQIRDAVILKIDIYNQLSDRLIDYQILTERSTTLYKSMVSISKEINHLL